jgi:hypothetical protein
MFEASLPGKRLVEKETIMIEIHLFRLCGDLVFDKHTTESLD